MVTRCEGAYEGVKSSGLGRVEAAQVKRQGEFFVRFYGYEDDLIVCVRRQLYVAVECV